MVNYCWGSSYGYYGQKYEDGVSSIDESKTIGIIQLGANTVATPASGTWSEYKPYADMVDFTDSNGTSHKVATVSGTQAVTFSYQSASSGISSSDAAAIVAAMNSSSNSSTATNTTPVAASSATPDMSDNSSIDSATVKTSDNGTAKISNIESEAEEIEIDDTVEVDGVSYKVKTIGKGALKNCDNVKTLTIPSSVTKIEKGAFKGADNLKTIRMNVKKSINVQKGAFNGVDTKKMTIKVSKKMSDKQLTKFEKTLTKAGYKGKVKRAL